MSKIDVLADFGDLCGECPIWDDRRQLLHWTDITGRRFFQWSSQLRTSSIIAENFEIAAFALHADGGLVVTNSNGFWLWDEAGEKSLIVDSVEGNSCALNDCIADSEGRVFSGSCFFDATREDYPLGYLFRLDLDGSVQILDEGLRLSNGLGFSPNQSNLYLADSAERCIYVYDYRPSDGTLKNKRTLVRVPSHEGIPDGLTVDAAGFIWSVHWFGGSLVRYDADGTVERRIAIPASQTTSMAFGGPDLTDIFVTSAAQPDALSLAPLGYHAADHYNGGKLFHLDLGIPGKTEYRARTRKRSSDAPH